MQRAKCKVQGKVQSAKCKVWKWKVALATLSELDRMRTVFPAACSSAPSEPISTGCWRSLSPLEAVPHRLEFDRLSNIRANRRTRPRHRTQFGASLEIPAACDLSARLGSSIVLMWRSAEADQPPPGPRSWPANDDRISKRPAQKDACDRSSRTAACPDRHATRVPLESPKIWKRARSTLHFLPYFSTVHFPLFTYFCTLHFCTLHLQGGK